MTDARPARRPSEPLTAQRGPGTSNSIAMTMRIRADDPDRLLAVVDVWGRPVNEGPRTAEEPSDDRR